MKHATGTSVLRQHRQRRRQRQQLFRAARLTDWQTTAFFVRLSIGQTHGRTVAWSVIVRSCSVDGVEFISFARQTETERKAASPYPHLLLNRGSARLKPRPRPPLPAPRSSIDSCANCISICFRSQETFEQCIHAAAVCSEGSETCVGCQ